MCCSVVSGQQMGMSIKENGRTTGRKGWGCSSSRTSNPSTKGCGETTSPCPGFTAATPSRGSWKFRSSWSPVARDCTRRASSWLLLARLRHVMTEPRDERILLFPLGNSTRFCMAPLFSIQVGHCKGKPGGLGLSQTAR